MDVLIIVIVIRSFCLPARNEVPARPSMEIEAPARLSVQTEVLARLYFCFQLP